MCLTHYINHFVSYHHVLSGTGKLYGYCIYKCIWHQWPWDPLSTTAVVLWCRWYSASVVKSYITGRMQFVSVLGHDLEPVPLSFGVPQGSVLGPVLFIMYAKPLSDLIAKYPLKHQSFADDTQLNTSFDSSNIDSAIEIIQHCTNDIQSWMVQNELQLNEGKTETLLVATSSSDKRPT